MAEKTTPTVIGAYPIHNLGFTVNIKGMGGDDTGMVSVEGLTSLKPNFEDVIDDYTPHGQDGWTDVQHTGNKFNVELELKRIVGDPGNDYLFGMMAKSGRDRNTSASVEFPLEKEKIIFNCLVEVTESPGGEMTELASLGITLHGKGKPTFTKMV